MLFFPIFLRFFSSWLQGPSSIVAFRGRVFHGVVWSRLKSVLYFVRNRQTFFPWKSFSEGPPIFALFVCNDGALILRLHVIAVPASLTLSLPAKTTKKLNMSGLDFSVLVLQRSNSFYLEAIFFSIFLRFRSSWLKGPSSIDASQGLVIHGVVWSRLELCFALSEIVKASVSWTFTDWICYVDFSDSYKSDNVFRCTVFIFWCYNS